MSVDLSDPLVTLTRNVWDLMREVAREHRPDCRISFDYNSVTMALHAHTPVGVYSMPISDEAKADVMEQQYGRIVSEVTGFVQQVSERFRDKEREVTMSYVSDNISGPS